MAYRTAMAPNQRTSLKYYSGCSSNIELTKSNIELPPPPPSGGIRRQRFVKASTAHILLLPIPKLEVPASKLQRWAQTDGERRREAAAVMKIPDRNGRTIGGKLGDDDDAVDE